MRPVVRFLFEFRCLLAVQILDERGWIFGTLTISTLFPLLVVFGLGRVGGQQTPEPLAYIITGSTVVSPNFQATNAFSQLILFVVMFAAPVLIPSEALPLPLQWFGLLLPPTYAADAIRRAVAGVSDVRLAIDLAVLLGCAVVSLVAVTYGLKWRLD